MVSNLVIELSSSEQYELGLLIEEVKGMRLNEDYRNLMKFGFQFSVRLPSRIIQAIYQFKLLLNYDFLVIKGNPFIAGKTPKRYRDPNDYTINDGEIISCLYSLITGHPIGFETQRKGHLFNHIIALKSYKDVVNSSSGSNYRFDFHTEDAFHYLRPDVIALVCLRNNERAVTNISSLRNVEIPEKTKSILFQPCFSLKSNFIHKDRRLEFGKQSILYGSWNEPYICFNQANVSWEELDPHQTSAVQWLNQVIEEQASAYILEEGDWLLINNLHALHSRDKYCPLYNEFSRWLVRLSIAFDLAKSRLYRNANENPVLMEQPF